MFNLPLPRVVSLSALLLTSGFCFGLNTITVTNTNDSGAGSLRQAILDANANVDTDATIHLSVAGTINLLSSLPDLNNTGGTYGTVIIDNTSSGAVTINGGATSRIFVLREGDVTIKDVTLTGGLGKGGNGGNGARGGGGALGAGGAIYAKTGVNLTVDGVTFSSNTAQGGNGGTGSLLAGIGGGGGGGMLADGGNNAVAIGGSGGGASGGTGGVAGNGGSGGAESGGGGGGALFSGGAGGFGGGGGGAGFGNGISGGAGGFGAAGGSGFTGGASGFAAGNSQAGIGGGNGGGGAALGGAVFLEHNGGTAATLTVKGNTVFNNSNTVTPGTGGAGGAQGKGDSVFLMNGIAYTVDTTGTVTASGVIGGEDAVNGSGNDGGVVKNGSGTLILGATNTYFGDTTLNAGTLEISSDGNLGDTDSNIVLAGGTLKTTAGVTSARDITVTGASIIDTDGNDTTLNGVISDIGTLTKEGAGTLTLSNILNDNTGGITIGGDTSSILSVGADANLGNVLGGLAFNGGTLKTTTGFTSARNIMMLGAGTVDTDVNDPTLTGVISGIDGPLIKEGVGILTLSGPNTHTGGTQINTGTLSISDDANLGGASGNLIFNGGALKTTAGITATRNITMTGAGTVDTNSNDSTFSGVMSGSGLFTKTGPGILTLSGTNTHTGGVTIVEGVVSITENANLGASSGTLTFLAGGGATLVADSSGAAINLNRPIVLTGNGTIQTNGTNGTTAGGIISGPCGLIKTGADTLILSGTNTYTGGTTITAGTLSVGSDANLGATSGPLTFDSGTLQTTAAATFARDVTVSINNGIVDTNGNDSSFGGTMSGPGVLFKKGAGTLNLSGTNSGFSGWFSINEGGIGITDDANLGNSSGTFEFSTLGTGALVTNSAGGAINLSRTFSLAGTGTFNTVGTNGVTISTNLTGAGGLTKTGADTLNLTGSNTYAGDTNINSGTLVIGTIPSQGVVGNIFVNAGGTLKGTGDLGTFPSTTLTVQGGTHAPGNSIGTQNILGDYNLNSGTLQIEFEPSSGGTNVDKINVSGTAVISPGVTIELIPLDAGFNPGDTFQFLDAANPILNDLTPTPFDPSTVTLSYSMWGAFKPILRLNPFDNTILEFEVDLGTFREMLNGRTNNSAVLATADYIDGLGVPAVDDGTDLYDVVTALRLLTASELEAALDQLHPRKLGDIFHVLGNSHLGLHRNITDNLWGTIPNTFWAKGFGAIMKQDSRDEFVGYDADSGGVLVGYDGNPDGNDALRVGVAGACWRDTIKWDRNAGGARADSVLGALYGQALGDLFFLDTLVSAGYSHIDTRRNIQFTGVDRKAEGNHSAYSLAGRLGGGIYFIRDNIMMKVFGYADIFHTRESSFTEHDADSINLEIERRNATCLRGQAGIELATEFSNVAENVFWTPMLRGSWLCRRTLHEDAIRSSFQGKTATFDVTPRSKTVHNIVPGVALKVEGTSGFYAMAYYDAQLSNKGLRGHEFGVHAGLQF